MEHLSIHLAYEARVCGSIQYRWMYPFKREIGGFKRTVKNKVQVEGSICQIYISKETSNFCFYERARVGRNDDGGESSIKPSLSIFNQPGHATRKCKDQWLTRNEWNSTHLHILINCDEVQPFRT